MPATNEGSSNDHVSEWGKLIDGRLTSNRKDGRIPGTPDELVTAVRTELDTEYKAQGLDKKAKFSKNTLGNWRLGKNRPNPEYLTIFSRLLSVTVTDQMDALGWSDPAERIADALSQRSVDTEIERLQGVIETLGVQWEEVPGRAVLDFTTHLMNTPDKSGPRWNVTLRPLRHGHRYPSVMSLVADISLAEGSRPLKWKQIEEQHGDYHPDLGRFGNSDESPSKVAKGDHEHDEALRIRAELRGLTAVHGYHPAGGFFHGGVNQLNGERLYNAWRHHYGPGTTDWSHLLVGDAYPAFPPKGRPQHRELKTVLVVGPQLAKPPAIGRHLAKALGWGFTTVDDLQIRVFGRQPTHSGRQRLHIEQALHLLLDGGKTGVRAGNGYVVSVTQPYAYGPDPDEPGADDGTIARLLANRDRQDVGIVYVRPPMAALVAWEQRQWRNVSVSRKPKSPNMANTVRQAMINFEQRAAPHSDNPLLALLAWEARRIVSPIPMDEMTHGDRGGVRYVEAPGPEDPLLADQALRVAHMVWQGMLSTHVNSAPLGGDLLKYEDALRSEAAKSAKLQPRVLKAAQLGNLAAVPTWETRFTSARRNQRQGPS